MVSFLRKRTGQDPRKFFQILLLSFLAVQLASFILHKILDLPLLKLGPMLVLFIIIIMIVSLFTIGKNITEITTKNAVLILLLFAGLVILMITLPRIIPDIFSIANLETSIDYQNILQSGLNSIINPGG